MNTKGPPSKPRALVLIEAIKDECAKAHSRYGEPQEYLDWISWLRDLAGEAEAEATRHNNGEGAK